MKKDIEWLKGRFRGRKIFKPQNDREIGYNMAIDEFSEYLDHLDEPEVFSAEEEPLYYALIKGHELLEDKAVKYWATSDYDTGDVFLFYQYQDKYVNTIVKNTKDKWNELGINDSNADFIKVKEVEE